MPNPLTGDFDAVLQVSGRTLNRLMASMHQNDFSNPQAPSFPHSVQVRLGQDHVINGVMGTVKAQAGVPRVTLIDGATDRFWIEVPVRARFLPDAGAMTIPQYMNGTVRAQYQVVDIDPRCFGWASKAANHLWVRVVPETVRFSGTTADDVDPTIIITPSATPAEDHAAIEDRISRQLAVLLITRFQATPQPVSKRYRRGSMRSIGTGDATAVVAPVTLGADPAGNIASVNNNFLQGADFGIALSTARVLSMAGPALELIGGFQRKIKVHIDTPPLTPDIDGEYQVSVNPPTTEWYPLGSFAVIKIKVSGSATSDHPLLPNATFGIDQDVTVNFDSGGERLWLGVGARGIKPDVGGPFGGLLDGMFKDRLENIVKPIVDDAVETLQPGASSVIGHKAELVTQLRNLDAGANARVEGAEFVPDGMILRGRVWLSPRQKPVVLFEKSAEQDALTAVKAWIPGGRVDKFEWSWSTFGTKVTGNTTHHDRFVLHRRRAGKGKWGIDMSFEGSEPLPGVDVSGRVCLRITGAQMNPVTGDMERVVSKTECQTFGISIYAGFQIDPGPLIAHDFPDVPELSREVPFPQLSQTDLSAPVAAKAPTNTLIVHVDNAFDHHAVASLGAALASSHRRDAGLVLLALVPEGHRLDERDGPVAGLQRMGAELGLATVVGEDIGGRWSRAFRLSSGSARLVNPNGEVTWHHDGRLDSRELIHALDNRLVTSPAPHLEYVAPVYGIGDRFPIEVVRPIDYAAMQDPCPPFPWSRGHLGTVVTFVAGVTDATMAHLRDLAARHERPDERGANLMVVIGGIGGRDAEAVGEQLGGRFTVIPDADNTITRRSGIRVWPTTMTLDRRGHVAALETGHERGVEQETATLAQ